MEKSLCSSQRWRLATFDFLIDFFVQLLLAVILLVAAGGVAIWKSEILTMPEKLDTIQMELRVLAARFDDFHAHFGDVVEAHIKKSVMEKIEQELHKPGGRKSISSL